MDLGQDDVSPYPELIEVLKKEAHRLEYTSYKGIQELRREIAQLHGVNIDKVIIIPGAKYGVSAMICKAKHVGLITPYWHGYMYAVKFFEKPYSVLETRF